MVFAVFSRAWNNIRENKSTAISGVVTTSISMVILGCVVLVYLNVIGLTQALFQQANYSVMIGLGADDVVRSRIIRELEQIPNIHNIHLVKSEEVKSELIESFGDAGNVLRKIKLPDFPDTIEFQLDRRLLLTSQEIEKIQAIDGVDAVISGRETKDQIDTFFSISEFVGIFLISLLVVSIILMIHNAIQLAVRVRIEEIEILKILGATRNFIQAPFVLEGMFIAVFGYLISLGVIYFLYTFVIAGITYNEATYGIAEFARFFSIEQMGLILLLIILLGLVSSLVATRRVMRDLNS